MQQGTYVRTVFHDLGQKLECGAHLTALRRTRIDQFSIDGSKTLEEIELMPLSEFQQLAHTDTSSGAFRFVGSS